MTPAQWSAELRALHEAEESGDRVLSATIRLRILGLRDAQREQLDYGAMDLALLDSLGADLRYLGWPEDALYIYRAACALLAAQAGSYGAVHFGCRLAHCHLDLADSHSATEILSRLFLPGQMIALEPMAATLDRLATAARSIDVALEPEVHYALSRLWAANGHLELAKSCALQAAELVAQRPHAALSAPELAVFAAELCLDRGDFAECDALCARWEEATPESASRAKWQVLRATLDAMTGYLSDAEQRLADLLQQPAPQLPEAVRCAAWWRRLHILLRLNRGQEAHALLGEAEADSLATQQDLQLFRASLEARQLPGPRTAKGTLEADAEPVRGSLRLAADAVATPDQAEQRPRARPRVCDEWGRLSACCLASIDRGALAAAGADLERLTQWAAAIDSPLVATRLAHLQAIHAYYAEEYERAAAISELAIVGYQALDMPGDEWAVGQLQGWLLRRLGSPLTKQEDFARQQSARLAAVQQRLADPRDRAYFVLNKWTFAEERIARHASKLAQNLAFISSWSKRLGRLLAPGKSQRVLTTMVRIHQAERPLAATRSPVPMGRGVDPLHEQLRWHPRDDGRRPGHAPRALAPRAAVLAYFVLPDRVLIGAACRTGATIVERRLTRAALWEQVRCSLATVWYAGRQLNLKQEHQLAALSDALGLQEILAALPKTIEELYIVPDDVVFQVPFAALPVGGVPLLSRAALGVLPSLAFVPKPVALRRGPVLGVAVPNSSIGGKDYEELPSAEHELHALGSLSTSTVHALIGDQATREATLSQLPTASVAHFACHGDFRPDDPHASGLLLQDSWLTIRDLRGMRLDALSLVTLGACWSGNLTVLPGRALVGLPAAFLDQGAQAVLAPLFRLADDSSAAFATALYPALQDFGLVQGLARVQRRWMMEKSPRSWAAYTLYLRGLPAQAPYRWLLSLRATMIERARRMSSWLYDAVVRAQTRQTIGDAERALMLQPVAKPLQDALGIQPVQQVQDTLQEAAASKLAGSIAPVKEQR